MGQLYWEHEKIGTTTLIFVHFDSESPSEVQMKYGTSKLEMFAAVTLIKKLKFYLAQHRFTLRYDNKGLP